MSNKDNNSIIEIFSGTIWEAEMVKSLLENAEIRCFLKNNVLNTNWYDPIISEGVKVMISSSAYNISKKIVDNYYKNMQEDKTK